jgi:dUTP pyrophosphatase
MNKFNVKKLSPDAILPTRANPDDVGLDIYSLETIVIEPGEGTAIKTGIAGEFSPGYVGMLTDRSSMARKGFKLAGGIIDPGYSGELGVVLRNISKRPMIIEKGDRIAQLLIIPVLTPEVVEVDSLGESIRGNKGWGSSGK